MSFESYATEPFGRKLKRLAKRYKSLAQDLTKVIEKLSENPKMGTPIGKDCFKIRIAVTSKSRGKSGGVRLITYVRIIHNSVYLMDIYDKSEQPTITDKELKMLIDILTQEELKQ